MVFTDKDVLEIEEYLRFWFGDLSEEEMSSVNMQRIIQMVIDRDPSYTGCQVVYYSAVEILKWLMREQSKEAGSSGTSGRVLKKKTEKVGAVTIAEEFSSDESSSSNPLGWDKVLEDLESNPSSIGCVVFSNADKANRVIFGGVSQKEYDRVRNDQDSRNGWNYSSPFRQTLADKLKR